MFAVVLITASGKKEASMIAKGILKAKLAACVNVVGKVESFFWWKGRIDRAGESLLLVKTRRARLGELIKLVRSLHSYSVPEIIALPIVAGEKTYLDWLDESVR